MIESKANRFDGECLALKNGVLKLNTRSIKTMSLVAAVTLVSTLMMSASPASAIKPLKGDRICLAEWHEPDAIEDSSVYIFLQEDFVIEIEESLNDSTPGGYNACEQFFASANNEAQYKDAGDLLSDPDFFVSGVDSYSSTDILEVILGNDSDCLEVNDNLNSPSDFPGLVVSEEKPCSLFVPIPRD